MAGTGKIRVSWLEWEFPDPRTTVRVSRLVFQFPLNPPLLTWRIDYSDDGLTVTESRSSADGPPVRTTDCVGVVFWHDSPYRDLAYGIIPPDTYSVEGVTIEAGEFLTEEAAETYRLSLHDETHPHS